MLERRNDERAGAAEAERGGGGSSRRRRALFWVLSGLAALGVGLVLLAKSSRAERALLDAALARVEGSMDGELSVDSYSEGSLFGKPLLRGVRIVEKDGRPLFSVDSLAISYSFSGLFFGDRRIESVEAWGLDGEIAKYPDELRYNLSRILGAAEENEEVGAAPPGADGPDGADEGTPLAIGRFTLRSGRIAIVVPEDPAQTSDSGGAGRVSSFVISDIDLDLKDLVIGTRDQADRATARLEGLAAEFELGQGTLRISDAEGDLAYGRDHFALDDAVISLPGSALAGEIEGRPAESDGPWVFDFLLATRGAAAGEDFAWLEPRLRGASLQGEAAVTVGESTRFVADLEVREPVGSATLRGGMETTSDGLYFDSLEVVADGLAGGTVEAWFGWTPPETTRLSGAVVLHGEAGEPYAKGAMDLNEVSEASETSLSLEFDGTLLLGEDIGARDLSVRTDPFRASGLEPLVPGARELLALAGFATVGARVDGSLSEGLAFTVALRNARMGATAQVLAEGTLREDAALGLLLDASARFDSVPLTTAASSGPEASPVASGVATLAGRLRDLELEARFEIAGGTVAVSGVTDVSAPGAFYRLGLEADSLLVSGLFDGLPPPSRLNLRASVDGRGLDRESMFLTASVEAWGSNVGRLPVDTLAASVSVADGFVSVADLQAVAGGVAVSGYGRLGALAPLDGEVRLAFETESLQGLRPLLYGPVEPAKDTLSPLQASLLAMTGVDVDALPDTVDLRLKGRAQGTLLVRGSIDDVDAELSVGIADAAYKREEMDSLTLTAVARGLPGLDGAWSLNAEARGLRLGARELTASFSGEMERRLGRARAGLAGGDDGRASVEADFSLEPGWVTVGLDALEIAADSVSYVLARPAEILWGSHAATVVDLELTSLGASPGNLRARGTLARVGITDFELAASGLDLAHAGELGDLEQWSLGGRVDLDLRISGPSHLPTMEAAWRIAEPRYQAFRLSALEGTMRYRDRRAHLDLRGRVGDRQALEARGSLPIDLALTPVSDRKAAGQVDVRVMADSLPAAIALAYFDDLEEVAGSVSGNIHLGGVPDTLRPSGSLIATNLEWSLVELGIRPAAGDGTFAVSPDGSVAVEFRTGTGSLIAQGQIALRPLGDPGLDMDLRFDEFLAVSRADMEAVVSGDLALTGSYRRPYVSGGLGIDEATLYVEEFERRAEVIDLSDPRLFGADTADFGAQSFLRGLSNPFLANLRAEIDLAAPRDTWLRSRDMSVELGGDLAVRYDRTQGDIVLVGELAVLRGAYSLLQRSFEVTGGTVGFQGIPGVNPILDIDAVSRIRRLNDEPLLMTASVEGRLSAPEVSLTTDEPGLVQADLIGYLIFGRPVSGFGSQTALAESPGGALATLISGAAASQLGTALAQELGIDYLSITQAGDYTLVGLANPLATTEVEIGQYIGRNAFAVLVLRPLAEQAGVGGFFGGVRLEWALGDDYLLETFFEDRFLRGGSGGLRGLGGLGVAPDQIVGVFLFREIGW